MFKNTKEFAKKIGDILIDLAKIVFAIAVLTPLVKESDTSNPSIIFSLVLLLSGIYIYMIGVKK